jgi:cysteine-rich repeat protein
LVRPWGQLALLALVGSGCDLRPPHVRLSIADPLNEAASAATLAVSTASGAPSMVPMGGRRFPVSIVLTAEGEEGPRVVLVEALALDGTVVGRALGPIEFKTDQGGATAEVVLGRPCDGQAVCNDGVYCNGEERCANRVCQSSPEPCPRAIVECGEVSCDEAARACICSYVGPIEVEPNDNPDQATAVAVSPDGRVATVRGEIGVPGDIDLFSVEVPTGHHLEASISIPGFDECVTSDVIELTLLAPDGTTALASGGPVRGDTSCDRIAPGSTPSAFALPAGRYYLAVSPVRQIMSYFLNVRVIAPGCGNGVRDSSERCDDGNVDAGDGCSPGCTLEIAQTVRAPGGAVSLELLDQDVVRVVQVDLDRDGQSITATVAGLLGGCASGTLLELLDPQGQPLGLVGPRGELGCTALRIPGDRAISGGLPGGTYFLAVSSAPGTFGRLDVELQVGVRNPACGNLVVESVAGEQCDEGDLRPGDGCAPNCRFEIGTRFSAPGGAAVLTLPALGYVVAEVDVMRPGQSITATAATPGGGCQTDTDFELRGPDLKVLGSRFGSLFDACAVLYYPLDRFARDLAPGRYFLLLSTDFGPGDAVRLEVGLREPRCGNGVTERQANEACDDGNDRNQDGCSTECRLEGEATPEREPNNTVPQAQITAAQIGLNLVIEGRISPAGDVDYYSFEVPPGRTATLTSRTYGQRGDRLSCEGDTVLSLFDAGGALITSNDDLLEVGCSLIDGGSDPRAAGLVPGRYFLRVHEYSGNRGIPAYALDIELR